MTKISSLFTLWLTTRITRVKVSTLRRIPCFDRPTKYVTRGRGGPHSQSQGERLQSRKLACGFEKLRGLRRKKSASSRASMGSMHLQTVNSKWDIIRAEAMKDGGGGIHRTDPPRRFCKGLWSCQFLPNVDSQVLFL